MKRSDHDHDRAFNLFSTSDGFGWSLTAARVAVGAVMLAHGLWKLGAFGGPGYSGTVQFFTGALQLPAVVAVVTMGIETIGALLLLAGAFTRLVSAGVIAIMLGAIATVHWPNGFFMNWGGSAAGEGFEMHILVIVMAAQLVMHGAGRAAVDPWLGRLFASLHRAEVAPST